MASDIHNRNGFSLIELLVALVVILGTTGLAISNYGSFADTQRVQQAGKTLQNNLHFIQNRAMIPLKPQECDQTNPLLSYRVSFMHNTYTYTPICGNSIPSNASVVFSLPENITFSPIPNSFEFAVLTGRPTRSVIITITNGVKWYSIQVSENGLIEDLGFQL